METEIFKHTRLKYFEVHFSTFLVCPNFFRQLTIRLRQNVKKLTKKPGSLASTSKLAKSSARTKATKATKSERAIKDFIVLVDSPILY